MQVICTDGTRFACDSFEVIDGGVKLFDADVREDGDPSNRYGPDADEYQVGFVPDVALRYIVPDGVEPAVGPADPPQRRRSPNSAAPSSSGRSRGSGTAQGSSRQ